MPAFQFVKFFLPDYSSRSIKNAKHAGAATNVPDECSIEVKEEAPRTVLNLQFLFSVCNKFCGKNKQCARTARSGNDQKPISPNHLLSQKQLRQYLVLARRNFTNAIKVATPAAFKIRAAIHQAGAKFMF